MLFHVLTCVQCAKKKKKKALKNARVPHFVVWEGCCDQPSAAHKKINTAVFLFGPFLEDLLELICS